MFRKSVFLAVVVFLFAAKVSVAQDTIPASDILKVWEKTAIDNVTVHYEDISRTFVTQFSDGPFENTNDKSKLITVKTAVFRRAKNLGMKAQYDDDVQSACNLLRGAGISSRKVSPYHYRVQIEPEGKTHMEGSTLTEAMLMWLEPVHSPVGRAVAAKRNEKLDVVGGDKGNRRVRIQEDAKSYLLAEEFDWRVIEMKVDKQIDVPPQWTLEYERSADKKLLLKRAVSTYSGNFEQVGWAPAFSSEFAVTAADFAELEEVNIAIKLPTPAVVEDNSAEVPNVYILRADGKKTPFSPAEFEKLRTEQQAEKKAAHKASAKSSPRSPRLRAKP